jgi:phosphopantetheinyl transferase
MRAEGSSPRIAVVGVSARTSRAVARRGLATAVHADDAALHAHLPEPRRTDWLSGRLALTEATARYTGARAPAPTMRVAYRSGGQPFLAGTDALFCSIAHSAGWGIGAVSSEPVGVDIERSRPRSAALLRYLLDAHEQALVAADAEPDEVVTRAWTVKEAAAKLLGAGLRIPPQAIRIEAADLVGFRVHVAMGSFETRQLQVHSVRVHRFWIAIAMASATARRPSLGWYRAPRI